MGFKLKKALGKIGGATIGSALAGPFGAVTGGILGNSIDQNQANQNGAPGGQPAPVARRGIKEILGSDEAFDTSAELDDAAYDKYLQSGEAARRREEDAATEGVLGNLQSRGFARSGIALKDIVTQVLGPSAERASGLAAQFGLERARRASEVSEAAKGRRLSSILQSDQGDISQLIGDQDRAERERTAQAERKASRQNAIVGAAGGLLGSGIAAFCFDPRTVVYMADGTKKMIGELVLGEETLGGKVTSVRRAFTSEMYDYDGVRVTGSHSVLEEGTWRHVEDSPVGSFIPGVSEVVSVVTSGHRVFVDGLGIQKTIEFADEAEHDLSARVGGTMTDVETLRELNRQEQIKRANKPVGVV